MVVGAFYVPCWGQKRLLSSYKTMLPQELINGNLVEGLVL